MRAIVSVAPTKVEADSRTFKQAASIARFGYASIVVEGRRSDFKGMSLPFELHSIGDSISKENVGSAGGSEALVGGNPSVRQGEITIMESLKKALPEWMKVPLSFVFKALISPMRYYYRNLVLPLRYIPKAALYYLHAPYQFPAVYRLCKRYKVPFIYDAHDFYSRIEEREERDPFTRRIIDPFYRYVESRCIKKAAAVVTVSDGVAALLRENFDRCPVVIRNCHDARLDQKSPQHLRERLGLSSDVFLLVSVGQAKKGSAILEALDALRMLPSSVHLAFLGNRYEVHLDAIRSRSLEKRVHIVPPVKPYEVVPFIRSADAALILYYSRSPNYLNCLPNGFFQSIAAELPLLYPELPEIKKLAERYELGIPIDPQIPESISGAVVELVGDSKQFSTYKQNLRVAEQELSWEKEEIILRDLISSVLRQDQGVEE